MNAARVEWVKHERIPTIDVFPLSGRRAIPVGNATINFPVTLRYPGEHAEDGYVPVIGGACINIVGEGRNYPTVIHRKSLGEIVRAGRVRALGRQKVLD